MSQESAGVRTDADYAWERLTIWARDFGRESMPVFTEDVKTLLHEVQRLRERVAELEMETTGDEY